jgi:hypothetical protein
MDLRRPSTRNRISTALVPLHHARWCAVMPGMRGILPLVLFFFAFTAQGFDDVTHAFKSWFSAYKKGEIDLYQPSTVPLRQEGREKFRYFKTEAVERMDALLEGLADRNDLKATKLLANAATFRFLRKPHLEIKKHYRQQPWILRSHALEALKKITDPESIEWLRMRYLKNDPAWDTPFRKVIAVSVLGIGRQNEDTKLLIALLKDRDPRVREKALAELGRMGGPEELSAVLELMNDKAPTVRVAAVQTMSGILANQETPDPALAERCLTVTAHYLDDQAWPVQDASLAMMERFRSLRSIPVLIGFLEKAAMDPDRYRNRIRYRAAEVLRSLTGQQFSELDPKQWKAWWLKNRESFRLDPAPSPALQGFQLDVPYFFNIPVNSDAVYFILDVSGSMRAPVDPSQPEQDPPAETKLDRARKELLNTLVALDPKVRFNIILFNDTVHPFADEPVKANEDTFKNAKAFFEAAQADGGTNIFDALHLALQIKSMGLVDRFGENLAFDTVFVLSDGVPTAGIVIDPKEILRIITSANQHIKIKINTISLGSEPNDFMRGLAENNYGKYIHIQ